jgi:hypothetical protein
VELHNSGDTENLTTKPPEQLLRAGDTTASRVYKAHDQLRQPLPQQTVTKATQLDDRGPESASEEYIRNKSRSLQISILSTTRLIIKMMDLK